MGNSRNVERLLDDAAGTDGYRCVISLKLLNGKARALGSNSKL
jgi:hypothetical protein